MHAKCTKCGGSFSTTSGSKECGGNARLHASALVTVSKFTACCVTKHCCAPLGIQIDGAGVMGVATFLGVLLHVTLWFCEGFL